MFPSSLVGFSQSKLKFTFNIAPPETSKSQAAAIVPAFTRNSRIFYRRMP